MPDEEGQAFGVLDGVALKDHRPIVIDLDVRGRVEVDDVANSIPIAMFEVVVTDDKVAAVI